MKIIIAGASGFIGSHLKSHFSKAGHQVLSISRHQGDIHWDPVGEEIDLQRLEGANVVINLCGESILGRWTPKKVAAIRASRLIPTHFLVRSLLKLKAPPKIYVGASAIGFYGDRGEEELTEKSAVGHGPLADICVGWEKAALPLQEKGIRTVFSRFGMVFGKEGALPKMALGFRIGLGGTLGDGHQYLSWIAIDDLTSAMLHVIEHSALEGPINFVAPQPVTNLVMTETLGKMLRRPTLSSMPAALLKLALKDGSLVFLSSEKVMPAKLLESGFVFSYPTLESALKKYLLQKE